MAHTVAIDPDIQNRLVQTIESDKDNRVSDIHVWKVGPNHYAAMISIVTHFPQPPEYYKQLIKDQDSLAHITVEVNACENEPCIQPSK